MKKGDYINITESGKKFYHPTKRIAKQCAEQCIKAWGHKFKAIGVTEDEIRKKNL